MILQKLSFLLLSCSIFFIASCSSPIKPALVDNPSDKAIDVYFDGRKYMIPPREQIEIDIKHGTVELIVNQEPPQSIKLDAKKSYLINPLKETYYVEDILYFKSEKDESDYIEKYGRQRSTIENFEVAGSYKKIPGTTLIEKKWTLGLDKGRQTSLNIKRLYANKKYVTVRKLHRKSDLQEELIDQIINELSE